MKHKAEYLAAGGVFCPFCKAPDIEGGPVEVNAGRTTQEMSCQKCSACWEDQYTLTNTVAVEPPEPT